MTHRYDRPSPALAPFGLATPVTTRPDPPVVHPPPLTLVGWWREWIEVVTGAVDPRRR